MFQRKPLNSAVIVALGTMAMGTASVQASTLFLPHIVSSPDVTTIVSVINVGKGLKDSGDLHYQLVFKNWETAGNAGDCDEINYNLPSSTYDIQTIDLGSPTSPGVIFEEDPHYNNNQLNVQYGPNDLYNMATQAKTSAYGADFAALRGYLLVDDGSATTKNGTQLFGEAVVLEYAFGSSWAYSAFGRSNQDFDYTASASQSGWPVNIMPLNDANALSTFMVTPVYGNSSNFLPNLRPELNIGPWDRFAWLALDADGSSDGLGPVMFDRDENPLSGSNPQKVVCVGRVDALSLLTSSSTAFYGGGWSYLMNYVPPRVGSSINASSQIVTYIIPRDDDAAVIYKLDYGVAFNGYEMNGGDGVFHASWLIPSATNNYYQ